MKHVHWRGEPGIVDQQVDRGELRRKLINHSCNRVQVAHVERHGVTLLAQLAQQLIEPVGAAPGDDDAPAIADQFARGSSADPRSGTGDKGGSVHWSLNLSISQSVAVGQSSIRAWAISAGGIAGASRGSAIMCKRCTSGACLATEA